MKFKLSVLTVWAALASVVVMVPAQAQSYNAKDKTQMRQLALDTCGKSSKAEVCNCFADHLANNFNEKEWRIFIADASKSSAPPSGVSEADLDTYGKKLAAAGNACGM